MITGLMFKNGIISAANNISNSRQAVDALNIFPVPDGDTGTNMSMTINAAAADIAAMPEDSSLGEVSKRTASALLRGARGNSGVILSLIFRGMSKAFKGLDEAGSKDVAKAFRMGCDAAYKAVMKPTEGTILTVIRKAAEAAEEIADIQDEPLKVCFAALQAAKQALAKTPEQLPVLKKAGVVDAGGQGLVLIFEGIQSVFENNAIVQPIDNEKKEEKQNDKSTVAAADEEIKFGYCSEFLIEKEKSAKEKDPLKLRAYLESIGDCVVVVDDNDIIKVHVHSNCPGDVIQSALKYGQLINIKIDNMRYQHRNAEEGKKADEAKRAKEDAAVDKAIENAQMDIPEAMLQTQCRQMLDDFSRRMQSQGLSMDQYFQFTGMTAEKMMEDMKPQALKRIQTRLVLEKVAEVENIQPTEEEVNEEISKMAEAYKMEADKLKELLGERELEQMKKNIK